MDLAIVQVDVKEVASRSELEIDGMPGLGGKDPDPVRVGQAVLPDRIEPDAAPRVIAEEQPVPVPRGVPRTGVESESRDRRARLHGAAVVRHRGLPVVVGEIGIDRLAGLEGRAEPEFREPRMTERPLVTGPAKVRDGTATKAGGAVDLLPEVLADIADPQLVRPRSDREAERVPHPI